jgi:hypothetical protein
VTFTFRIAGWWPGYTAAATPDGNVRIDASGQGSVTVPMAPGRQRLQLRLYDGGSTVAQWLYPVTVLAR